MAYYAEIIEGALHLDAALFRYNKESQTLTIDLPTLLFYAGSARTKAYPERTEPEEFPRTLILLNTQTGGERLFHFLKTQRAKEDLSSPITGWIFKDASEELTLFIQSPEP